jgi:hypothetical protein
VKILSGDGDGALASGLERHAGVPVEIVEDAALARSGLGRGGKEKNQQQDQEWGNAHAQAM